MKGINIKLKNILNISTKLNIYLILWHFHFEDGIFDEENRRPTNTYWIFPFIIAVITFIVFAILASLTAGPGGLASIGYGPEDDGGSSCGLDSDVLDKTIRIFVDERDCERKVNFSNTVGCTGEPWVRIKMSSILDFFWKKIMNKTFSDLCQRLPHRRLWCVIVQPKQL